MRRMQWRWRRAQERCRRRWGDIRRFSRAGKLSSDEPMEGMGGGECKGRRPFVRQLMSITGRMPVVSQWMSQVIRRSAQQVQMFKREQGELESALEELGRERPAVGRLKGKRGIGTITLRGWSRRSSTSVGSPRMTS